MNIDALHQETSLSEDYTELIDEKEHIDEEDVKEIVENIKEAQYFNASSMAPLTPTALVSTSTCRGDTG